MFGLAIARPSSPKASAMVFSRPMRSDTQPKNGRVRPLQKRSIVSASGRAAKPHTASLAMPKSPANAPICDVTIRPEVDIIDIIANISQKTGLRSMDAVSMSRSAAPLASRVGAAATGGARRPRAARTPTAPKIRPNFSSVAW